MEWLDNVAGPGYSSALLWTFAALILLVIVLIIIKLVRSLTFGTFVAGGRNRKTRLAVMDATAVDSQRRLVLVRRDDIEHLLLIGGPTDLVIERDIRLTQQRRPSLAGEGSEQPSRPRPLDQQPAPRPATQPRAPEPAPMTRPTATPQQPAQPFQSYSPQAAPSAAPQPVPAAPQPTPAAAPQPMPAAAPQPMARPIPAPAPRPETRLPLSAPLQAPIRHEPTVSVPAPQAQSPAAPEPALPPQQHDEIDESLLQELDVAFSEGDQDGKAPEVSLDDEMARLLGELSSPKR